MASQKPAIVAEDNHHLAHSRAALQPVKLSLILQAGQTLYPAALADFCPLALGVAHTFSSQLIGKGKMDTWYLYLIECRNGAYYAGITNDLEARYKAHESGRGARFTRANPPVKLLASAPFPDRASASRAEWKIKQLPREKKLAFITEAQTHGTP